MANNKGLQLVNLDLLLPLLHDIKSLWDMGEKPQRLYRRLNDCIRQLEGDEEDETRADRIAAAVARTKREILADIASGTVNAAVKTYSELHDYVDANGYGGAFEGMPILADDDSNIEECHANTDFLECGPPRSRSMVAGRKAGMTTITRMLQFGLNWRVHLACGHKLDVSAGDALRQQLYIGKRYECSECAK